MGRKSGYKGKSNISSVNSGESKNKNSISLKKKNSDNLNIYNDNNKGIELNINNAFNNEENKQQEKEIIRKIKVTRAYIYLCFCFIRKRKIIQNYLLDEGMNIITEKMDFLLYPDFLPKNLYNEKLSLCFLFLLSSFILFPDPILISSFI